MRIFSGILLLPLAMALAFPVAARCQTASRIDNSDVQSWNEVQITTVLNKWADLYIGGAIWLGKNLSRFQEEKAVIGVNFKPSHSVTLSPLFAQLRVRNFAGAVLPEYRIYLRGTYRFPLKHFGLSHRSQYEYRFRTIGNTWRFAPSVTIDKPLPKRFAQGLKLFATDEPFYDGGAKRFSRNRLSFGINKTFNIKLSLDIYYLRQDDNFLHPNLIRAIGTTWKIKL